MDTNNPIIALAQKATKPASVSVDYIDPYDIDDSFAIELIDSYRIDVTYDSDDTCHLNNFSEGTLLSSQGRGLIAALRNWAVKYNNLYKELPEDE